MGEQRPAARTFRDLVVWQKAHRFVLAVYALTASFPKSETYGLIAADAQGGGVDSGEHSGGVPQARQSRQGPISEHLGSSLEESRYYLILTEDLGYGSTGELLNSLEEVSRLLHGYSQGDSGFFF